MGELASEGTVFHANPSIGIMIELPSCLDIIDETAEVGDYVISHAGYAIHKIDEASAKEKLDCLQEIIDNEIY